jgi:hypothetical protein
MTRALLLALAIANLQTPSPTPAPKGLTVSGCITGDAAARDRFILTDSEGGTTYRLSGSTVRNYVGRRVQVTGGLADSKRLHIAGGLVPSPNVAGQAGAIDPAQAAMAASATGTPSSLLPTLKVTRVRALPGSCPER